MDRVQNISDKFYYAAQVYKCKKKIYAPVVDMKQFHAEYSNNIRRHFKKIIPPPGPLRGARDLCILVLYHGH